MIPRRYIRINEQIRAPQIRLIGADGKQVGIVAPGEGVQKARDAGLDLVEISPTAKPPVCRIIDYGKYLYALEKQDKEARKKQHVIEVKEIQVTPKIEEHDYQTKLRSALTFLERGDKVKLTLKFRGREVMHPELGQRVLDRFRQDVADFGEIERSEGLDKKTMVVLYNPIKKKKKSAPPIEKPGNLSPERKPAEGVAGAQTKDEQGSPSTI